LNGASSTKTLARRVEVRATAKASFDKSAELGHLLECSWWLHRSNHKVLLFCRAARDFVEGLLSGAWAHYACHFDVAGTPDV